MLLMNKGSKIQINSLETIYYKLPTCNYLCFSIPLNNMFIIASSLSS
jgi:hypothetical protein